MAARSSQLLEVDFEALLGGDRRIRGGNEASQSDRQEPYPETDQAGVAKDDRCWQGNSVRGDPPMTTD